MLPATTISPSNSCFSFETSCMTSPASTVELFQSGSFRVEDRTNLGISFNLSANSPLRDGHRAARNSYVRRPNSWASAPSASSSRTLAASSRPRSPTRPTQPPRPKPSAPAGSWTTPSTVTFSLTTILPIQVLLSLAFSATTVGPRQHTYRLGPGRAASGTRRGWVFRPGHRASQVGGNQPSVRRVPDENRVGLGKCDERGHRRRAGSNDVVAAIACHDHQLKIAVVAIGAGDPVRVHDLDATRSLARSRHVPSVNTSACRQL